MSPPQGLAYFPGIDHLLSASITLGHGISPSSARMQIAPQASFTAEAGTLKFEYDGAAVEFPDCKVDRSGLARNERGEIIELSILDRRWKWRFGQISGKYNVWRDDSTIQAGEGGGPLADTERTPQELAALYLDAMGEEAYDVSELPNETRPPVDHDHDNPAEALADLCESQSCRVVLRLDNTVRIVRVGVGADLPQEFLLENSAAVNLPEKPDRIAVVCGPSFFEVDFPLEAVGLDVAAGSGDSQSDTIKPIDELSYKPAGGWSIADLPYFNNVGTGAGGEDVTGLRTLAVKSVFRYYRIMRPVNIPGFDASSEGQITRLEQILPVFEEQVRVATENFDRAPLAAAVFGVWYPGLDELGNTQTSLTPQGDFPPPGGPGGVSISPFYSRGFTIDAARGLVIFNEPVYQNSTPDAAAVTIAPAQLVLRTKCHVRDAETLATKRHVRGRSTGGNLGTPTRYIKRDEIVLTHVPTYDAASYGSFPAGGVDPRAVTAVATNLDEVDERCDRYIDLALEEYEQPLPRQVMAIGIRPIELDGAIGQVSYQVGPSGATTAVARNSEPSNLALAYGERRASESARRSAEEARKSRTSAAIRQIRRAVAAGRRAR
ncbi:MAG: hypothetical protein WD063_02760 [Pirellulales bacterium]